MLDWVKNILGSLSKKLETRKAVNATIKELSSLTDQELNDIGIHRSMIRTVAEQSINPNLKGWV